MNISQSKLTENQSSQRRLIDINVYQFIEAIFTDSYKPVELVRKKVLIRELYSVNKACAAQIEEPGTQKCSSQQGVDINGVYLAQALTLMFSVGQWKSNAVQYFPQWYYMYLVFMDNTKWEKQ